MEDKRFQVALNYFKSKGWTAFPFQLHAWKDYLDGKSGLLNAPTGSGKTLVYFECIKKIIHNGINKLS